MWQQFTSSQVHALLHVADTKLAYNLDCVYLENKKFLPQTFTAISAS